MCESIGNTIDVKFEKLQNAPESIDRALFEILTSVIFEMSIFVVYVISDANDAYTTTLSILSSACVKTISS